MLVSTVVHGEHRDGGKHVPALLAVANARSRTYRYNNRLCAASLRGTT